MRYTEAESGEKTMQENILCHQKGKDAMFKTWHAPRRNIFIYMHSDGGSIVCSEKIYPIQKGVLCFVGAGKYHYTMPEEPEVYERSKMFIEPEKMRKIQLLFLQNEEFSKFCEGGFVYCIVEESERTKVDQIFEELAACRDDEAEATLCSCCIRLAVLINRYQLEQTESANGFLSRAMEFINSNIFREISIDEICSHIHISKYHFCRQFKKSTGMTVMDYIVKTRIVLAKGLLISEKIPVSEVSSRCGFSSVSYFCRVFKEETGKTPLEYRREK